MRAVDGFQPIHWDFAGSFAQDFRRFGEGDEPVHTFTPLWCASKTDNAGKASPSHRRKSTHVGHELWGRRLAGSSAAANPLRGAPPSPRSPKAAFGADGIQTSKNRAFHRRVDELDGLVGVLFAIEALPASLKTPFAGEELVSPDCRGRSGPWTIGRHIRRRRLGPTAIATRNISS